MPLNTCESTYNQKGWPTKIGTQTAHDSRILLNLRSPNLMTVGKTQELPNNQLDFPVGQHSLGWKTSMSSMVLPFQCPTVINGHFRNPQNMALHGTVHPF